MDGTIINDSMTAAGKDRKWLNLELDKLGVTLENVFMGQINSYGELTVDVFDDKIQCALSSGSSFIDGDD